jgi:hypothetical protein
VEEPDERLIQGSPRVSDGEIPSAETNPEIRTALEAKRRHGDELTAISDGLIALLKESYGRGPTQASPTTRTILSSVSSAAATPRSSRPFATAAAARR